MKKLMITLFTQSIDALFLCALLVITYHYGAVGRQAGYCYCAGVTPAVSMTLNYLD